MKASEEKIVVEQILNATVEKVWNAITKHDQMIQWFFENIPDFEAREGFTVSFDVDSGERIFPHVWTIKEVVEKKKIVYDWSYIDFGGQSFVTFELFAQGDKTLIRLDNEVIKDFDDNIPEFRRESCLGGWNYFICERLKAYIDRTN
jgi:uncharacterized protein YndB with AHSA1/START domain